MMFCRKKLGQDELVEKWQRYCLENHQDFSLDDITNIIQAESSSLIGWVRKNRYYSYSLKERNDRHQDPSIKYEALKNFFTALALLILSVLPALGIAIVAMRQSLIVTLLVSPFLFGFFALISQDSCSHFAACGRLLIQNYILHVPVETLKSFGTDALVVMEIGIFHVKYIKNGFGYVESYNTYFFSRDQIQEAGLRLVGTRLARYSKLVFGEATTENNQQEITLGVFDETKVAQIIEQFDANSQV